MLSFVTLCTAAVLSLARAQGTCDVCGVRYEHIKDYSTPFEESGAFPTCTYYKDAACCSAETVDMIDKGYAIYDFGEEKYSWNACNTDDPTVPKISAACEAYFKAEACFYECDVNVAKYRRHADCKFDAQTGESDNGWEVYGMPIKKEYCDAWYEACKDDFYCYDAKNKNRDWFAHPALHGKGQCTKASGNCKTYGSLFGPGTASGGKGICEMWGNAFVYSNAAEAYVMNFTGPNPNDAVHSTVAPPDPCPDHEVSEEGRNSACGEEAKAFPAIETTPCEVCHLRNEHTKDVAVAEAGLEGVCKKYSANSCCSADIADSIQQSAGLYGPEYRWEKCYFYHQGLNDTLTANATLMAKYDECNRWFQEEECLYECDVNAGKWRKHETCYGEDNSENAWQIEGMPLKASECDAFYEACKDLVMCACSGPDCPAGASPKSLFGLASSDSLCRDSTKYCTKTIGQVWANGKEWCEKLWDNSFVYEKHEAKAYSMVWSSEAEFKSASDSLTVGTFESNPNDKVYTEKPWPPPCNFTTATAEMCDSDGNVVEDGEAGVTQASAARSMRSGVLLTALAALQAAMW